jgi:ribonuclease D
VHYLTHQEELVGLVGYLQGEGRLALDTESNSTFAYRPQTCLVQISATEADFVIDPLSISDLSPLNSLTSNPRIEKIVHGAEYDVLALKREFALEFCHIFDTALAARVLGLEKHGLTTLTQTYFGVKLDKHWQRADWGKRPLSAAQLQYARMDSRYLLPLRDILKANLQYKERWEEAQELFGELDQLTPAPEIDPFLAISGAARLKPKALARLYALYHWREQTAQTLNIPISHVMSNEALIKVARQHPSNLKDLGDLLKVSGRWLRVHGKEILQALEQAAQQPQPRLKRPRYDRATLARHELLKDWRKNRAQARGVSSDVVLPSELLWKLAKHPPTSLADLSTQLGPWRLTHYGEDILRLLAGDPPSK